MNQIVKFFFPHFIFFQVIGLPVIAQAPQSPNDFFAIALENSPLLNDLNNQITLAKIDSLKYQATYGFIISADANAMYSPTINGWGYDNTLTNGRNLFAGFRVSKEIANKNFSKARLNTFNATIDQITAQKNISVLSLKRQITDQYIATYASEQKLKLTAEILSLLNEEDLVLKKLTQAAVFKQTDYLAFKVTLQQNELNLQQQKAEWKNNYALLNLICGKVDTNFTPLAPLEIPANIPITNFGESVYTQAFTADKLKIENQRAVVTYSYKPKFNVFSDAGYQSALNLTAYKNFGWAIGLGLTIPIYDGHQKKMLLQQNELELKTREKYLKQQETQYQQFTLQTEVQIDQYKKMLETAKQQLRYAKTLVEANAKQLPTGDVRIVDFILSITNYMSLKTNIIQYQQTVDTLQNQLQYLIL